MKSLTNVFQNILLVRVKTWDCVGLRQTKRTPAQENMVKSRTKCIRSQLGIFGTRQMEPNKSCQKKLSFWRSLLVINHKHSSKCLTICRRNYGLNFLTKYLFSCDKDRVRIRTIISSVYLCNELIIANWFVNICLALSLKTTPVPQCLRNRNK